MSKKLKDSDRKLVDATIDALNKVKAKWQGKLTDAELDLVNGALNHQVDQIQQAMGVFSLAYGRKAPTMALALLEHFQAAISGIARACELDERDVLVRQTLGGVGGMPS